MTQELLNYNFDFSSYREIIEHFHAVVKKFLILASNRFKYDEIWKIGKIYFALTKLINLNSQLGHPIDKDLFYK